MAIYLKEETINNPDINSISLYNKSGILTSKDSNGNEKSYSSNKLFQRIQKNSNYTILEDDISGFTIIYADDLSDNISYTLPVGSFGKRIYIANISNSNFSVIVKSLSGKILSQGLEYSDIILNKTKIAVELFCLKANLWIVNNKNKLFNLKFNKTSTKTISGGGSRSLGIDYLGNAWGWGHNYYSQLGDNSTTSRSTPVQVYGGISFIQISAGNYHSLGIDHSGNAWAWGYNDSGRLGDNSTTLRLTPVQICGGISFIQISGGSSHSLGIDHSGNAWGWGLNSYGRLGDNSTTTRSTPVRVCGGISFIQISAGDSHSLGIDHSGNAWAWGYNDHGRLGDNSTTSRRTPVRVCGGISFIQISTGNYHSLGIDHFGNAWGWGANSYGQLGDNTTTSRRTPVNIII